MIGGEYIDDVRLSLGRNIYTDEMLLCRRNDTAENTILQRDIDTANSWINLSASTGLFPAKDNVTLTLLVPFAHSVSFYIFCVKLPEYGMNYHLRL